MTLLTEATDVFAAAEGSDRCVVAFLCRRQAVPESIFGGRERDAIATALHQLESEGWCLSVRAMFDPAGGHEPMAFDTGFAHAVDFAGAFEAPSLSAALAGTVRLEGAGWSRGLATEWLLGPREFATVGGGGDATLHGWGFLAFWEWNDAWAAASASERRAYDAECDVAFKGDVALDIAIAGRHRLDWASAWHHIGIWEAPSLDAIDTAMRGHEHAADFKFTTSRHVIGRRRRLLDMLALH